MNQNFRVDSSSEVTWWSQDISLSLVSTQLILDVGWKTGDLSLSKALSPGERSHKNTSGHLKLTWQVRNLRNLKHKGGSLPWDICWVPGLWRRLGRWMKASKRQSGTAAVPVVIRNEKPTRKGYLPKIYGPFLPQAICQNLATWDRRLRLGPTKP